MRDSDGLPMCRRLVMASLCFWAVGVEAEAWQTQASLSVSEVYSDNVCLEANNPQSDLVTTVTPGLSIEGSNGARASLDLELALELNSLSDQDACGSGNDEDTDTANPQLQALGSLELVENFINVDATAHVQQNKVDPFRAAGDSSLNRTDNHNTSYDYSVSPYMTWRVSNVAQVNLRYTYDGQENSVQAVGNSDSQSLQLQLTNTGADKFTWALDGDYQTVDYQEDSSASDDKLSSANVSLAYQFSRKWQLNGSTGRDFNEFDSADAEIDGTRWDMGLAWTPNDRTSVELGSGNRYFGNTPRLNISHRLKRSELSASYSKTLTYTRALRNDQIVLPVIDASGNPINLSNGEPLLISTNLTTLTRSPVVDERWQLAYRLQGRRTSLNINAVGSTQLGEEDNQESEFLTYSLGLDRRLARDLSANIQLSMSSSQTQSDNSNQPADTDTKRLYLGLQRELGQYTSLSFNYTLTDRNSLQAEDTYKENRLSVSLQVAL